MMTATYIAQQFNCTTMLNNTQTFIFNIDNDLNLSVQNSDGSFTSDWSTTLYNFFASNNASSIVSPSLIQTATAQVSAQILYNPAGINGSVSQGALLLGPCGG